MCLPQLPKLLIPPPPHPTVPDPWEIPPTPLHTPTPIVTFPFVWPFTPPSQTLLNRTLPTEVLVPDSDGEEDGYDTDVFSSSDEEEPDTSSKDTVMEQINGTSACADMEI